MRICSYTENQVITLNTNFTVSGTAENISTVNIEAYKSGETPVILASDVTVSSGVFSKTVQLSSADFEMGDTVVIKSYITTKESSVNVKILFSGTIWTEATSSAEFSARAQHTSFVYSNKMWVIGGSSYDSSMNFFNDVWYSTDGITWTEATSSAGFSDRMGHTSVVYDNKMWVIGGYSYDGSGNFFNDVWYSTNGAWTEATSSAAFSVRYDHTSLVYDNKMWVIGGSDESNMNDVWYSTDGITWTEATSSAAFSVRSGHTSLVYDNKMWVIGGRGGSNMNDVWYSTDGITWTEATSSAAFSARNNHTSLVYNNKMWVIGGQRENDVWYSADGITWTEATSSAAFSARNSHTSLVYDNKMWVIGGYDDSGTVNYLNDVWWNE